MPYVNTILLSIQFYSIGLKRNFVYGIPRIGAVYNLARIYIMYSGAWQYKNHVCVLSPKNSISL